MVTRGRPSVHVTDLFRSTRALEMLVSRLARAVVLARVLNRGRALHMHGIVPLMRHGRTQLLGRILCHPTTLITRAKLAFIELVVEVRVFTPKLVSITLALTRSRHLVLAVTPSPVDAIVLR